MKITKYFLAVAFFNLLIFNGITSCKKKADATPAVSSIGSTCPSATTLASVENIQIFPADHPLNTDISGLTKDSKSDAIIANIGLTRGLKADFGSGLYEGAKIGIPFVIVCANQTKTPIIYRGNAYDANYSSESDAGPFPIPLNAPIEGSGAAQSGDSHVLAVDIDNKKLYEMYNTNVNGNSWEASGGSVFDLQTNTFRPAGWTSADAAGLPIFPCLVRYDEVASGTIDHAIRFTVSKSKTFKGYIHPARHLVSGTGGLSNSLPMGTRLRLRADFDVSTYPKNVQVILVAMKKYGLILADIGSDMYITGAPDERWNNDELRLLGNVKAGDFIVTQMGTVVTQ